ncbi:hypothetical protein [Georgenia ruanii]|uniref:hypothetical protein n=1 Tax=Georgenia ruanii TaxID=348442 RepID=UPI00186B427E|nr:hypothetical protein [Georgenia ruanii]
MSESPYQSSQPPHGYNEPYQQAPYAGGYPPAAPPAYGNGYGYNQAAADANSAATLSLVFGILGVIVLPILAPLALWQASKAEKLGKSATAGKVLGWIGVVFLALGVLAFVFFVIVAAVGAGGY